MTPRGGKSTRSPRVVRTIGRYALYGEIASGGMATVHFGRLGGAGGFSRPVAIKRLHPQYAKDPEFRTMLVDEARLVARIRHQNVVPTLDVVVSQDELFLVMEYVEGESLWRLMKAAHDKRVRIPPHVVMTIVSHVLHGLHAAHEARSENGAALDIVHRDVSPQNVLVGTDGAARVLDFGIARATVRAETTREGRVKGKLSYMAPEQLGGGQITRRADVYATSVMLWELLAGRRLFHRGMNPEALLVEKLLRSHVPRPSAHNESVPPAVDAVVLKGLSRDPEERYATAREMAIALESCGKLATLSEVGAWVERMALDSLQKRARRMAELESCSLPSAREVVTPTPSPSPSTSPVVASIPVAAFALGPPPLPTRVESLASLDGPTRVDPILSFDGGAAEAPHSTRSTGVLHIVERRARRSLASLLEPDIEEKVLERVRFLARERKRVVIASVVALGAFVASIGGVGAGVRAIAARVLDGSSQGALARPDREAHNVLVAPAAPCPEGMTPVPGGRFFMGSDDDMAAERPAHHVVLAPYCIDVFEVTTADYKACGERGDCKRANVTNDWAGVTAADHKSFDGLCNARDPVARGKHPINCVDWEMASTYCQSRGERLPREAEWEFAARGTDGRKYPWGDEQPGPRLLNACGRECVEWGRKNHIDEEAMFTADDGWATTSPVGSFPDGQSKFGAQDMVGNVWEWVGDWYGQYDDGAKTDPRGPATGHDRVIRGGAWNGAYADWVRPTFRYHDPPDTKSYGIGFRCAADRGAYSRDLRAR